MNQEIVIWKRIIRKINESIGKDSIQCLRLLRCVDCVM